MTDRPKPATGPHRALSLRSWSVALADGSTARIMDRDRTTALLSAAELFPGFLRLDREGDW